MAYGYMAPVAREGIVAKPHRVCVHLDRSGMICGLPESHDIHGPVEPGCLWPQDHHAYQDGEAFNWMDLDPAYIND